MTTPFTSTHNEHPLCNDQEDKTMMMQRLDEDETRVDQGHSKGGDKTIYVKHRGGLQAMPEQNLRHLTIKSNEVHVVHGGKIMNPGAIGHLRQQMRLSTSWTRCQAEEKKKGRENRIRVQVIRAYLKT